jgi:hypothetical protein
VSLGTARTAPRRGLENIYPGEPPSWYTGEDGCHKCTRPGNGTGVAAMPVCHVGSNVSGYGEDTSWRTICSSRTGAWLTAQAGEVATRGTKFDHVRLGSTTAAERFADRPDRAVLAIESEQSSLDRYHLVRLSLRRIIRRVVDKMVTAVGRARNSAMEGRRPCRSQDSVMSTLRKIPSSR